MKKKILAILLCAFMILPCFALFANAEGEYTNIAKEGTPSCSSIWNNWSSIRSINDGVIDAQLYEHKYGYEFWRPHTCEQGDGIPIDSAPWFRLNFDDYYEINKIVLYSECTSGITYVFEALVQGEWVEIGSRAHSEGTVYIGSDNYTYNHVKVLTLPVSPTVTTRSIRVRYTNFTGWDPGFISEIQVMGRPGEAPEFDVPEGAVLSTNAALSGMASSSSSEKGSYPYLANDDKTNTSWVSGGTSSEWIQVDFDKEYLLDNAKVDFSGCASGSSYSIDIQLCMNGSWSSVYTGNATTGSATPVGADFGSAKKASGMKVIFTSTGGSTASVSELIATINLTDSKCVFLGDYITNAKKLSTAAGNLACYGEPYAQSSLKYAGISSPSYINDGETGDSAKSWFAEDTAANVYVGVTLREAHDVDQVVLYFNDAILEGDTAGNFVMSYEIQVKKTGSTSFTTVATGTSYDATTKKYIVSVSFDKVNTDDVRVLFTSNGNLYPYLKELEVYSHEDATTYYKYPHLATMSTTRAPVKATTKFADVSYPKRAPMLEKISPVVHLAFHNDLRDILFLSRI